MQKVVFVDVFCLITVNSGCICKVFYFTSNYNNALILCKLNDVIIKVEIYNINELKLDENKSFIDIKNDSNVLNITNIKTIIMYTKLNSNKNCLVNVHHNEYLFFNTFNFKIYI